MPTAVEVPEKAIEPVAATPEALSVKPIAETFGLILEIDKVSIKDLPAFAICDFAPNKSLNSFLLKTPSLSSPLEAVPLIIQPTKRIERSPASFAVNADLILDVPFGNDCPIIYLFFELI